MDRYPLVLYAHFLAIVAAVAASALLHFNFVRVRRATRVSEARDALATVARTAPFMPLFAVALLATGAYLVHLRWGWREGWVIAGIAGLLSMPVITLLVQKPRMRAWAQRLGEAKDGPLDAELARAIRDPLAWGAMTYNHVMALAIMFVMVAKPSFGASLGVLVMAPLLGVWSAAAAKSAAAG